MSNELISRSPDLKRLRDEGYDVVVRSGYLLVRGVPYVNSQKQVQRGVLICKLVLAGDVTAQPDDHVAYFEGEYPCRPDGSRIEQIQNRSGRQELASGVTSDHTFSAKPQPTGNYNDYYSKVTTYVAILGGPAQEIIPNTTARIFPTIESGQAEEVFNYIDTASSRAEIDLVTSRLRSQKIAIVGCGGTGSYILDLVAKTPASEIHIYDGDRFFQHNAFRSPGAPSVVELRTQPKKVEHLKAIYSKMHRHITAHDTFVGDSNVDELLKMDFVFLSFDGGDAKRRLVKKLEDAGVPFVDVGMGITQDGKSLGGIVRVTTSTDDKRDHVWEKQRIPFVEGGLNEYDQNIQIADLNALNAALAVIRWKKHLGFYRDYGREHYMAYAIDGNKLFNEDQP